MNETLHTKNNTLNKSSNTFVLTPQEFVTVALLDLRDGFGPAGLRRMMNIWEAADCDNLLIVNLAPGNLWLQPGEEGVGSSYRSGCRTATLCFLSCLIEYECEAYSR